MTADGLTIETVALKTIMPLRFAILRRNEADDSRCKYPGDEAPQAIHLRAIRNGSAFGMVSILPDSRILLADAPQAISRIRGLGVLHHLQGQGLGRWILTRAIGIAQENDLLPTWGSGRSHLATFYHSFGAVTASSAYDISGTGEHLDFYIPLGARDTR